MPKTLYSPKFSNDIVRALYREGQRRCLPMTRVADDLLRQALAAADSDNPVLRLCKEEPVRDLNVA